MSIGDSMTLVSCLAGLMVALPGLAVFLSMIFDGTTECAASRLANGGKAAFFVGLVPVIVVGYVGVGLISAGSIFQLVGAVVIALLLAWLFTGLGVVARLIGLKIAAMTQQSGNRWNETIIGAFVLAFALAFPLVGWFLIFPLSAITGGGSIVLALFQRRRHSVTIQGVPTTAAGD